MSKYLKMDLKSRVGWREGGVCASRIGSTKFDLSEFVNIFVKVLIVFVKKSIIIFLNILK